MDDFLKSPELQAAAWGAIVSGLLALVKLIWRPGPEQVAKLQQLLVLFVATVGGAVGANLSAGWDWGKFGWSIVLALLAAWGTYGAGKSAQIAGRSILGKGSE